MKRFLLAVLFVFPFLINAQNLNITWLDAIGGAAGDEVVQSTVVDASGNVYISGSFTGTVNFNPQGTATSLTSAGGSDGFFGKYTSAGILVWVKQLGGTGNEEIYATAVDASGNVYVAGYFSGTVDFDPSAAVGNLTSSGLVDIFYGKYSSTGALTWVNAHGSTDNDAAYAIKVDVSGNVYVTGYFVGTVDFDPSNVSTNNKTAIGTTDVFLIKLTSAGALAWIDTFGSTSPDVGYSVDVDNSNVYVSGYYSGTIDLDPGASNSATGNLGSSDGFFGKYDISTGALVWWATVRSTDADEVTSIVVSGTNIYLGGVFSSSASFFSNSGNVSKTSNGAIDVFVAKYDGTTSLPTHTWINTFGGTSNDRSNLLAVDASGNVYSTGYFAGTADFDPLTGTSYTSNGLNDIYIASYASADGSLRVARTLGGTSDEEGTTIAVDGTGNVYTGGYFQGTTSFDFNSNLQDKASLGSADAYVAKYAQSAFAAEPVAQPTNLVVVDLQNTTFTYNISAATGNPTGYLHIYKVGSAPTALPVDGIELNVGDVLSDGSIVQYADNIVAGNVYSSLIAGTSYFVKIFSFNGYGTSINYLTTNPLSATITTTGGALATEPTAQPTTLVFGTATNNSIPVSFTAPATAPAGYIAIRKAGSAPTSDPVDGISYSLGATLGDGVVVYSGAAASFTDTGLAANTTYFYKIYAFNGASGTTNYLITTPLAGSKATATVTLATEPTTQPTALVFGAVTNTSIPISFTAAAPAAAGYIAVRKAGSAPTTDPVDGNAYTAGTTLGDGTVVFSGTSTSFTDNGLASGTTYFYKIYSFNGSAATTNYLTSVAALSGSKATTSSLATEPTAQPATLLFGTATDVAIPVSFTAPATPPSGYIAVRKAGSASTADPVDGAAYTSGAVLGDGVVAYSGSATSFTDTGLTAGTTYFYKIYSFNGSSTTTNYLATSPLTGSKATISSAATEPSNSPTSLVFSSITSSSYSFSFTAAIAGTVAADGYIGIRKTGSAPTSVPVDGTTYNAGDAFGDGFINFVGTGTAYNQTTSVSAATTYYLVIYSYKGSGSSINYKQLSPLTGSVTTLPNPDTTPPVIGSNTTPTTTKAGQAVKVSLTITDPESGVSSVEMNYGESTSFDWTETYVALTNTSGNIWEFTIPATAVKEQGIEYIVTAYNNNGDYSDTGIIGVSITIDQNGLTIPFSAGSAQNNYKIVSIPLTLESKSVDNVFGDDFGKYGDKSKWRLFRYSGGKTNELNGSSSINPGEGYWLLSSASATLDSGPGKTVGRISEPFTINVTQGFNQIGNPYVINLLWDDIKTYSYDTHDNSTLGLGNLRTYSGGSWSNGTILNKYEGGFVMANTAGTLVFPAEKKAAAGRVESKPIVPLRNSIDMDNWELNFELSNSLQTMNFSGIGMNRNASEQYDRFDDFTVPRFMDYIELNHASKELFNISYTKDIVPTAENHVWEFFVESNANELMTMKWDNSYFGQNDKQLVLWDVNQQRGLDMRSISQYIFNKSSSGHFKVYFGDEKFIKEKTAVDQLVFHDVFPNPASDRVTISFSVPTDDRVTVDVIDLLGRKIATVADGHFTAGYHEINWNTTDHAGNALSNGIYITQVKTLYRDQQKRLSINK